MLALIGDPEAKAYELLFSFSSPENKERFLDLVRTNEEMGDSYVNEEFTVPTIKEIRQARPLAAVPPDDVVRHATLTTTTWRQIVKTMALLPGILIEPPD